VPRVAEINGLAKAGVQVTVPVSKGCINSRRSHTVPMDSLCFFCISQHASGIDSFHDSFTNHSPTRQETY
jgi:hypothetical protein